jgi:hypothetical protein
MHSVRLSDAAVGIANYLNHHWYGPSEGVCRDSSVGLFSGAYGLVIGMFYKSVTPCHTTLGYVRSWRRRRNNLDLVPHMIGCTTELVVRGPLHSGIWHTVAHHMAQFEFGKITKTTSSMATEIPGGYLRRLGYINSPVAVAKHCKHAKSLTVAKRDGQRGGAQFKTIITTSPT